MLLCDQALPSSTLFTPHRPVVLLSRVTHGFGNKNQPSLLFILPYSGKRFLFCSSPEWKGTSTSWLLWQLPLGLCPCRLSWALHLDLRQSLLPAFGNTDVQGLICLCSSQYRKEIWILKSVQYTRHFRQLPGRGGEGSSIPPRQGHLFLGCTDALLPFNSFFPIAVVYNLHFRPYTWR